MMASCNLTSFAAFSGFLGRVMVVVGKNLLVLGCRVVTVAECAPTLLIYQRKTTDNAQN